MFSINNYKINIFQWNINGFYNRLNEINLLINSQKLKTLCLQETNFTLN